MNLPSTVSVIERDKVKIIQVNTSVAQAEISLFGGHLLSYIPQQDGRERIWTSPKAIYDGQSAIRGGVPICWPWFGALYPNNDDTLPFHGYVRKQQWQLHSAEEKADSVILVLAPTTSIGAGVNQNVDVSLVINIGKVLTLDLITLNKDVAPFTFTCALHTYFAVNDVRLTELKGLSGQYADKTRDFAHYDTPTEYLFSEETDRVHNTAPRSLMIEENGLTTHIESQGHDSIVVWNPWQENSETMGDMTDDGYKHMLCVETAITKGLTIEPNQHHTLTQVIC